MNLAVPVHGCRAWNLVELHTMSLQTPTPPDNAGPSEQQLKRPAGEQVPDDHQTADLILRLKNGELAEARLALAERNILDRFLTTQPRHFEVLLRLCRGDVPESPDAAWRKSLEVLKQRRSVLDDGTVRPLTRNVILSSYKVTPDGPVMAQPFALTNEQNRELADLVDRQLDENRATFVRKILSGIDNDRSR
jgi:hypothetical protein